MNTKEALEALIEEDGLDQALTYFASVIDEKSERIEKLEEALREIAGARPECCCISDAMQGIARKALEGKDG
jgi:hypothetical protein